MIADSYQGKRLNSPNDVVVKSDGSIWFTDPPYGILSDYEGHKAEQENGNNVYRVDGQSGAISVVADDFIRPNGLAFSPDEKKLYIVDSAGGRTKGQPKHIRVFDVGENGKLSGGKEFADCTAGRFDGMRFDTDGPHLGRDRRRRALPRPRRHADRQGEDPGDLLQRRVRRGQAQHALHHGDQFALWRAAARERREDVLGIPVAGKRSESATASGASLAPARYRTTRNPMPVDPPPPPTA